MIMRTIIGLLLGAGAFVMLLAVPSPAPHPRFVHTEGNRLLDPDGKILQLRGINLGNWLVPEGYMFGFDGNGPKAPHELEELVAEMMGPEKASAFWQQYRDNYITEDDMRFLHESGFNIVRVPLHYRFFGGDNAEGFRLVDRLAGWAGKYGIYIILDLHCAPGGQTGTNIDDSRGYPWLFASPQAQAQTIQLWQRIASHYRDNATILGYDLLNEPLPDLPELQRYHAQLEPLYKRITAGIRYVDSHHVIILGGANWGTDFTVFGPLFDANALYSFHYYHGAAISKALESYLDFSARYNVPLYLGEAGENPDKWIHALMNTLEANHIGWSFWPYKKMNSSSSAVTWQKPANWQEILDFASRDKNETPDKHMTGRPSLEHIDAAFYGLLENILFVHCKINAGYLKALSQP